MSKDQVEDHLPPFRVRPRFKISTKHKISEIQEIFKLALDQDSTIEAHIIPGFIRLRVHPKNQHYWSPQLSLSLYEENKDSIISGVYGPRPSVWTMFIFFYSLIGFAVVFISLFGFSKIALGNPAPILWLLPFLILLFFSLYLISYFGQKLGHDQMIVLHHFVERTIGTPLI